MSDHDMILTAISEAKMQHLRCEHFDHTEERHIAWNVEQALTPIFHSKVHDCCVTAQQWGELSTRVAAQDFPLLPKPEWQQDVAYVAFVIDMLAKAQSELLAAMEFTQQYAGVPAIEGWSWWDAFRKYASAEDVARWEQWEAKRQERELAKANGGWVVVISDGHADVTEDDPETPVDEAPVPAQPRSTVAASNHSSTGPHPGGTIEQWEHDAALAVYLSRYPSPPWKNSRPEMFAWFELIGLLGHEPTTYQPHPEPQEWPATPEQAEHGAPE